MDYFLIPARSGSKSVIDKNIYPLNGKPLLYWSIKISLTFSKEVYVSTNSDEYAKISQEHGAKIIMRPEFTCTDTARDILFLQHFVYAKALNLDDRIILMRPTTPLRRIPVIKKALETDLANYTSLRSIHPLSESPHKMFKKKGDILIPFMDNADCNAPKQNYPVCYNPNGYIDIIKVDRIINNADDYHGYCGGSICAFETERITEVDSMEEMIILDNEMKGIGYDV